MTILSKKQRFVFNICHKWTRDYVESASSKRMFKVNLMHLFMPACRGKRKSQVVKIVYSLSQNYCQTIKTIQKYLVLYCWGQDEYLQWIYVVPLYISRLGIKPGTKLIILNYKMKLNLRNKFSDVKRINIDVSRCLFTIFLLDLAKYICAAVQNRFQGFR